MIDAPTSPVEIDEIIKSKISNFRAPDTQPCTCRIPSSFVPPCGTQSASSSFFGSSVDIQDTSAVESFCGEKSFEESLIIFPVSHEHVLSLYHQGPMRFLECLTHSALGAHGGPDNTAAEPSSLDRMSSKKRCLVKNDGNFITARM